MTCINTNTHLSLAPHICSFLSIFLCLPLSKVKKTPSQFSLPIQMSRTYVSKYLSDFIPSSGTEEDISNGFSLSLPLPHTYTCILSTYIHIYCIYLGMLLQKLGHPQRCLILLPHAEMKCLHSSQDQVCCILPKISKYKLKIGHHAAEMIENFLCPNSQQIINHPMIDPKIK